MDCPNCGRELPLLAAVLAQTERGTSCPHCWTRLRLLAPKLVMLPRQRRAKRPPALRRAA
jgi:DNA-directed RNA polymerase subunit RPC12/RpoP